ncbi:hypothetical protein D3C76_1860660 [compost metagenome]
MFCYLVFRALVAIAAWVDQPSLHDRLKIPGIDGLSFEGRLGLLVDRKLTER